MPFQFYCPQGHLLEGHESMMGQQSQCPMCGTIFLVPVTTPQPAAAVHSFTPPIEQPPAAPPAAAEPPAPEPQAPPEPRVVRIPCPNGHELETPSDMFGQQALCPYCNVQFELRYEDSIEARDAETEARRLKEEQFNQALLKWSIRAAILVGASIFIMIVWSIVSAYL
jgi:hypothetical protein